LYAWRFQRCAGASALDIIGGADLQLNGKEGAVSKNLKRHFYKAFLFY
jgi:hypothetical protein